ncbi:MAG TPA: FG-GAP-like repeat-containing protein, partial [Bryobacteraceae bacterium]|nr:FG-GAP-like repeat-containing protein [Bryobacteraceae bacterium]
LPNILYRNRGDGTFEDITQATGLGLLDGTASALFADFTNSGTQDLLVVRTSGPLLFLNHGGGKFELRPDAFQFSKPPSGTFTGVAAADYDRDGLLDVYFCLYAYYQGLSQYTHPKPYYDAQNGPPNFLLRNRGDGRFEDVTEGSGMNQNNNRFTFACGWCDYNADGWPDLFVANDFGRKNFYRNNGNGTFTDIAREAGVEDYGAGMSVSWFDYDNDGRPDLYVTDMWSAAGKRVTEQNYFLPGVEESTRRAYRKHAAGNSLFKNEGGREPLLDTSNKARVAMGRWSWSADSWDFDHDGSNDLYVTSGFISGPKRQDLSSFFWRQIVARSLDTGSGSLDYELAWNAINELIRADHSWNGYERNVCFLNNCDGTFSEVSFLLGLDFTDDSRAFGLGDFDGDGRLEVILKNRSGPQLRILQNEMPSIGNSLVLRLQGRKGNRDAIGATVTIERGNVRQTRYLQAGSGFLSQHSKEIHFGVGPETEPFEATVRWPNGLTQEFKNVPVNHRIIITEGEASFNAAPFRSRRRRKKAPGPPPDRSRPGQFGTWLLEPMPALPFSLPDLEGQIRTLGQFAGKSLLLVAVASGCEASRQQLAALEKYTTQFRTKAVELIAMNMNGSTDEMRSLVRSTGIQFPVLLADQRTAGVYEILYRYLFDRRRDLETPVSFLIDKGGSVIKVYQASVDPASVLHDVLQQPRNAEQRIQRAIGSTGHYHAGPPRRNYFTYGVAFIQSEHVDAALACFQEAAARNPNYAPAYYNIGTIYLNKQMLPEARTNLERAVALDPQDADAWTNLGAIAGQQKRYDEALDNLAQAVRVNPAHLVALQNLVMLYRWQGRLDKAQQAIENAIKAQPNDPEFHFALGMLLAGQEKFEGARKELARAVELRGNDAITLNNLGVVYLRLGRQADALTSFERSRQLSPDYDRPYLNTALIYKQAGQEQKAKAILQSFAERHPENDEVKKTLHELGQ